jgi:hypothetical protein
LHPGRKSKPLALETDLQGETQSMIECHHFSEFEVARWLWIETVLGNCQEVVTAGHTFLWQSFVRAKRYF